MRGTSRGHYVTTGKMNGRSQGSPSAFRWHALSHPTRFPRLALRLAEPHRVSAVMEHIDLTTNLRRALQGEGDLPGLLLRLLARASTRGTPSTTRS